MGGDSTCQDHPDSATVRRGRARRRCPTSTRSRWRRRPADVAQTVMFSVPATGPTASTSPSSRSTPRATTTAPSTTPPTRRRMSSDWDCVGDGLRLSLPRPAVGGVQRAVHARPAATLGGDAGRLRLRRRHRRGSAARCTRWTVRSPRSAGAPGSGADRLRLGRDARRRGFRSRFGRLLRPVAARATRRSSGRAGRRLQALARVGAPSLHRARRARPAASRSTRSASAPMRDRSSAVTPRPSSGACPPWPRARRRRRLMVPVGARRARLTSISAGSPRRRTTGSASARSTAATGPGPHAVAEMTTTAINYTKLPRRPSKARVSSRPRPGDRRWSRRWRRCAAPGTSCWRRSRCSRSPPTCTGARGRPRPGPEAQRYGPGARPPAAGAPRPRPPRPHGPYEVARVGGRAPPPSLTTGARPL